MMETKNCSIAGVAFVVEKAGYDRLDGYLNLIAESYADEEGREEIISDIEARIAEIILSEQNNKSVVSLLRIEQILEQMGAPEQLDEGRATSGKRTTSGGDGQRSNPSFPRRLYRDLSNHKLGGVCSGFARFFKVDPSLVRLGVMAPFLCFVFVSAMFGAGAFLSDLLLNIFLVIVLSYIVMWFGLPVAKTARQKLEQDGEMINLNSIVDEMSSPSTPDGASKSIIAAVVSTLGLILLAALRVMMALVIFVLMLVSLLLSFLFVAAIFSADENAWLAALSVLMILLPVLGLVWVLMLLIVGRKPSLKPLLIGVMVWFLGVVVVLWGASQEGWVEYFDRNIRRIESLNWGSDEVARIMKYDTEDGRNEKVQCYFNGNRVSVEKMDGRDTIAADNQMRILLDGGDVEVVIDKNATSIVVGDDDLEVEQ